MAALGQEDNQLQHRLTTSAGQSRSLADQLKNLQKVAKDTEAMAQALLEVETIDHKQVENLFKYHSLYAPGEEPKKEDDEESPLPPMPKDEGPSPSLYSE